MKYLTKLNDWAALKLMAIYGMAITIWIFALYSLLGAVVSSSTQNHMLYWSNAAQLVFCPLSIYVGKKLVDNQKTHKQDMTDLHTKIDAVHKHLGITNKAKKS